MLDYFIKIIFSPISWGLIAIVAAFKYGNGMQYVDVKEIVKDYLKCFRDDKQTIKFLYIVPIFLAQATNYARLTDSAVLELLTLTLSIFTAMLFTIMSLLENKPLPAMLVGYTASKDKEEVRDQANIIIFYEILISVIMLILCFLVPIFENITPFIRNQYFTFSCFTIASCSLYFLFYHFLLNLLIVVKRTFFLNHNITDKKIEKQYKKR